MMANSECGQSGGSPSDVAMDDCPNTPAGCSVAAESPFLSPAPTAAAGSLSLMFLRRDHIIPVYLSADGSAVEHTRFGSFPHSTLLGRDWGSQVVSSVVRGGGAVFTKRSRLVRQQVQALAGEKRKRDGLSTPTDQPDSPDNRDQAGSLEISQSTSGFAHLLPPTPEMWTLSLPHRTQVVYTPDYSYVLSRLRVQPGCRIIEAGAGSGSFTHAAVRAIFSGYPASSSARKAKPNRRIGRVFSYEFHEPRAQQLQTELVAHGIDSLVTLTHRDVYSHGFGLAETDGSKGPLADAIFLDLPNPWLALPHLTRQAGGNAINPRRAVSVCAFLPCIEQVMKTADTMRSLGFVEVSMVELAHRNIEVRRERLGGTIGAARSVDEAVGQLRTITDERRIVQQIQIRQQRAKQEDNGSRESVASLVRAEKRQRGKGADKDKTTVEEVPETIATHRTEQELKTHTSYLLFAVLPREWTAEHEARAAARWGARSQE